MAPTFWKTTRFALDLQQPRIMGIVNLTPDSFSDGGSYTQQKTALVHCEQLLREGADILDIGGESTKPGVPPVSLEEELQRVLPVVREAVQLNVPISVDTYKTAVMQAVLDLGVDIINDIWALRQPGAQEVVAQHEACGVCIMHMHGTPQTMQVLPMQGDVLPEVKAFLGDRYAHLRRAGVAHERIVYDYGIGFGKTVKQNFSLLARQHELLKDGVPLLAGWSRKSSLGAVTGRAVAGRQAASVAAALLAVQGGARIVRVHDVQATRDAMEVWKAAQANAGV